MKKSNTCVSSYIVTGLHNIIYIAKLIVLSQHQNGGDWDDTFTQCVSFNETISNLIISIETIFD